MVETEQLEILSNGYYCVNYVYKIDIYKSFRPLINDFLRKMAKFRHQENQDVSAGFSLYPECHVFPFADGFQHRQITGIKKVESAIGSFLFPPGMTDFIQFLPAAAVIIKG